MQTQHQRQPGCQHCPRYAQPREENRGRNCAHHNSQQDSDHRHIAVGPLLGFGFAVVNVRSAIPNAPAITRSDFSTPTIPAEAIAPTPINRT